MEQNLNLSSIQFQYRGPEMGDSAHQVTAHMGNRLVGRMTWNAKGITSLDVPHELRRHGIATAMYGEGQRLAGEKNRIPTVKHSADRTNAGDAWARSVGGKLPRRRRD